MRLGHLERVQIKLRALALVFIGSGEKLTKKEYIYDQAAGKIGVPDLARLAGYLSAQGKLPAFETFILHPRNNDLRVFLDSSSIKPKDYGAFVRYTIDAGEAADTEHFREVLMFIKGPDGRPYIPGSSVKGAIRTAIAAQLAADGNYAGSAAAVERAADDYRGPRWYLTREAGDLERRMFSRLEYRDPADDRRSRPDDMVNDIMRGIQVSDSAPIEFDNLTLCGKYDRKPDGYVKPLPIYRECLAPGTETVLALTIERPVLAKAGMDVKYIENALHAFADKHYEYYEQQFAELPEDNAAAATQGVDIVIGGGAGYVAKTVTYPLLRDRERALRLVSKMMQKQFPIHKHEQDAGRYKVSPHTLKTTRYKGAYYQMGRCELIFA